MESPQNSDCSPHSVEGEGNLSAICESMNSETYKSLLHLIQDKLSKNAKELQVTILTTLYKDCSTCIKQSLYAITHHLSNTTVCVTTLSEYLNDTVNLLALLTKFIETIGPEFMTCCTMKTFPTSVGDIIVTVSSHCKESEQLYGFNLKAVEQLLVDLFRNCHKLQSIYLTTLEKDFVFDLTNVEEKKVLLKALKINLKIGEALRSVDTKAQVVQWRTMIEVYQKYAAALSNTSILHDSIAVLCPLTSYYIQSAIEEYHDDKIVPKSMKLANFLLKTLQKVCHIFNHAAIKEYDDIFGLFFYIYENSSHLQTAAKRSQFKNLITSPSECLLEQLLYNETFGNELLNSDIKQIKQKGNFLGFTLIITSVMDCVTQGHENVNVTPSQLIDCLYRILSECNAWNLDVTLYEEGKSYGLFEHLLIHSLALAVTLNCEEYNLLEKHMIEAILSTNHVSALFSSNMWALLARHNPQLLFNQVIWLCTMYNQLENHAMFHISPQRVHLTRTIARLFSLMEPDDKIKICRQFRILNDDNLSLWAALGVKSLPIEARNTVQSGIFTKLSQLQSLNNVEPDDIQKITKVVSVAATCSFTSEIDDLMAAWSRLRRARLACSTRWYYDYLQALIALTEAMCHQSCLKNVNLIKVLDYVTELIQQSGDEFKLLFINILCKMATTNLCESRRDDFRIAFKYLCQSGDIVRNKLILALKEEYAHKNISRILSTAEDHTLREIYFKIKHEIEIENMEDTDFKFTHKCLDSNIPGMKISSVSNERKESSGNFDFLDANNLFGNDDDIEESASKKAKLDSTKAEAVIKSLEANAASLRAMNRNVFSMECKSRIQKVCDELIRINK